MPAVGSGSLFEIRLYSSFLGVACQNVFWYYGDFVPDTVFAVNVEGAFENEVAASWEASVSASWDSVRVTCDEVTSNQNFFDAGSNIGPGTQAGETLSPQACFGIRLLRSTKDTRSGWKRLVGVIETAQVNGKITSAQDALLDTLGQDFRTDLVVGAETVSPVIVRKVYLGDPPVLQDPIFWIYNEIASHVVLEDITTQNSRKFAR